MGAFDDRFNKAEKHSFVRELEAGRLSHAYIVEGAEGVGKTVFADYCAAAVLCTGTGSKPCGKCPACRKIADGEHPDVRVFEPDGAQITVGTIREIKKTLNVLPNEGDKKIYIIREGQKMNVQAQNALLKFFEEPPESAVFFILTDKREALLPTVISRGRMITLHAAADGEIAAFLLEKYPRKDKAEIDSAAGMSEGCPGKACVLLEKKHTVIMADVAAYGDILFSGGKFETIAYLKRKKYDRIRAKEFMSVLAVLIDDVIHAKQKNSRLAFLNPEAAAKYASAATETKLMRMSAETARAYELLDSNANINLTMTAFAGRINDIKR